MSKLFDKKSIWIDAAKKVINKGKERNLFENLVCLTGAIRRHKKDAFNRFLPFGEYFGDRWLRASDYGFGEASSIYDSAVVIGDVCVGKNTWVGPNVVLDGSGGLSIGSFCSISAGVQIYSHDSVDWATTGGQADYSYAKTTVGDNTYIGPNSIIVKGVTIGHGCIIGAQSFVNVDVTDGQKVAGSPVRLIKDV